MQYPITLSFKLLALASQISILDANGQLLGYAKQKLLKLKEDIRIFSDQSQTTELYSVKADRVIDFSARYNFFESPTGNLLGSIRRRGMRSLWRVHYEIFDSSDRMILQIKEEKGWVKVVDALVGEIPVVGMFTGYFLNPTYLVLRSNETTVANVRKKPAFLESKFELQPLSTFSSIEETTMVLGVLVMTLLERSRG